jgi:hypothetical protein
MNLHWEPNPNAHQLPAVKVGDLVELKYIKSTWLYSVKLKVTAVNADFMEGKIIGITDWNNQINLCSDSEHDLIGKNELFKQQEIQRIN